MRTWPRILRVLICSLALMSTQHMVTAEAQECPGGYSAIFQLDGGELEPRLAAVIRSSWHLCVTGPWWVKAKEWPGSSTQVIKLVHDAYAISLASVC